LGPYASALFYAQLTRLTRAASDQEHIDMILRSAPHVPDRSAYICGKGGENPLNALIEVCSSLEGMSDVIAIPCVTAHHFYQELSQAVSVPILDMHRIIADGVRTVSPLGVMATEGTVVSGRLRSVLLENGIVPVLPEDQAQVTRLIYSVKAGYPPDHGSFRAQVLSLAEKGAEKILLACTELSVYMDPGANNDMPPLCDASELFARRCIMAVGGKVIDQCP
jgi:aspartate racemase